jgi:predicted type IV restriction endonuclease
MMVIGLISTEEEAQELQFIAKICTIENRIRHIIYIEKAKNRRQLHFANRAETSKISGEYHP